ncbi:hypothetical protein EDB19DRAFT_1904373 [Suillus lakei]|nr:hypothetical protein EDB19DRAFT_1904373 [Suillus lakei]
MSSKAYVVPVDPKNPAGNAAPDVNPVTLWSLLPQPQKPAKVAQAVAAHLALYNFSLKASPPSAFDPRGTADVSNTLDISMNASSPDWDRGIVYANAQNLARTVSS